MVMSCQRPPSFSGASASRRDVGRGDRDLPDVPRRPERGAVDDQRGAHEGEEDRRDPEEADVERTDPEIEEFAAYERAAGHAVLALEAEHGHDLKPPPGIRAARVTVRIVSRRRPGLEPATAIVCRLVSDLSLAYLAGAGIGDISLRSGGRLRMGSFEPVEAVGREQDEVDQKREPEQNVNRAISVLRGSKSSQTRHMIFLLKRMW